MKKLTIIVGLIILVVTVVFSLILYSKDDKRDSQPSKISQDDTTRPSDAQPVTPAEPGKYIEYSKESLANTTGTRLLFFHAAWCPQCRALEKSIKETTLPADVTVFKVDYDTNQSLRKQYGVTLQTTVVKLTPAGDLEKKFVAYDTPNINSVLSNLQ